MSFVVAPTFISDLRDEADRVEQLTGDRLVAALLRAQADEAESRLLQKPAPEPLLGRLVLEFGSRSAMRKPGSSSTLRRGEGGL